MGIYCLGTVSSFRGRGVAKEMIKSASKVSLQHGTDYLFLQSFSKEGFTKLYKKIGFELLYKKKVYALYQAVDT
jgi:ribosomal protein S18 acetylase RimI-like enzyme